MMVCSFIEFLTEVSYEKSVSRKQEIKVPMYMLYQKGWDYNIWVI